jgi:hypothetical protein
MRITSPAAGYSGTGPGGVVFTDGAAEVNLTDADARRAFAGPLAYYREHGYGIDGEAPEPAAVPMPADPREIPDVQMVGAPLRDAAVDPHPGDFLPPTNAGEPGDLGNPHGPYVVAPGIHGLSGPGPIVPGPVGRMGTAEDGSPVVLTDTAEQERRETAAAQAVLVERQHVGDVTEALAEEVGVTPDGSVSTPAGRSDAAEPLDPPRHGDPKADWLDHAAALDPEADLSGLTKAELIAKYDRPA